MYIGVEGVLFLGCVDKELDGLFVIWELVWFLLKKNSVFYVGLGILVKISLMV